MRRKYTIPLSNIKRRKVRRAETITPIISKKYESCLSKPFQNSDTLIIAGKLQKLSYGLQIRIAENYSSKEHILDLFLNTLKPNYSDLGPPDQVNDRHENTNGLTINELFFIQITAKPDMFDIGICGEQFVLHRENFSQTGRFLQIGGSIAFLTQVQHCSGAPVALPLWHSTSLLRSENYFINDFPIAMQIGYVVIVTALPYGNANGSVEICFPKNQRLVPALKILVDFAEPQSIVLMGMNDNEEIEEEHPPGFPFQMNRKFRIAVGFSKDNFLLAINGTNYARFRYRSSLLPSDINRYYIRSNGDPKVKILSTDHTTAIDCQFTGFEEYSDVNYQIT